MRTTICKECNGHGTLDVPSYLPESIQKDLKILIAKHDELLSEIIINIPLNVSHEICVEVSSDDYISTYWNTPLVNETDIESTKEFKAAVNKRKKEWVAFDKKVKAFAKKHSLKESDVWDELE